jgi:hypothetical protein
MMDDIINEACGILECKECPWFKLCISPMRFTAEDIRRQMASPQPWLPQPAPDTETQNLLANMAAAAQNQMLEGCPVFIERLRGSARLAQRIKEIVQNWNEEEDK